MCLIYLLLRQHLKIVKLAIEQTIAVAEFEDLRASWSFLFLAMTYRFYFLVEVWRQQRLDVEIQTESFAHGLFEKYYIWVRPNSLYTKAGVRSLTCIVAPGSIHRWRGKRLGL